MQMKVEYKRLTNFYSALHRKKFPVRTNLGEFLLTHEDHSWVWELKNNRESIYFHGENDVGSIMEKLENDKPICLEFYVRNFWKTPIERMSYLSLECSNL
jgi:hypothetical protein